MDNSKNQITTVDEYIDSFPLHVQEVLETLRETIKEVAPEVQEKISYHMPTFTLDGHSLVYFAAWKKHIGFYPISTEMETFIKELSDYKTSGKGTIQFPLGEPLPLPLIRKIVEFRIQECNGHPQYDA